MDPKIEAYLSLLFKWNRTYRLTAFETEEEAYRLGVVPSLAVQEHLPEEGPMLDVGSGGGFPAIPLALARPGVPWTLTEPSRQKAAFLREVAIHLGLTYRVVTSPVEVLLRAEPGPWSAVTIRGVHLRRGLIKRLSGALAPGGLLAVWSGGEREVQYARWASESGLSVEEILLKTTPPVPLLLGRVPRGTRPGIS